MPKVSIHIPAPRTGKPNTTLLVIIGIIPPIIIRAPFTNNKTEISEDFSFIDMKNATVDSIIGGTPKPIPRVFASIRSIFSSLD